MSSINHISNHSKGEHGTVRSYVIGFALSLLFTAIPYYLVVNKTVSGSALQTTILTFAVVQMLIQIFFFLHLGRGPKPLYNIVFFVATVGTILVVAVGSVFIMDHLHYSMAPADVTKKLAQDEGIYQVGGEKTGACQETYTDHKIVISDGKATPAYVDARLCDKLTFVNEDNQEREISFGTYPDRGTYAGETELPLRTSRRANTITLNQTGTYEFYDLLDPETTGNFTVSPR